MKNFVQEGNTVTAVAAADIASGAGMLSGSLFGVAAHTAASGAEVEIVTKGVFDLPKSAGASTAVTAFGKVYWDDSAGEVTGVATDNTLIGVALAAADDNAVVARVRLNGVSV